MYKKIYIEITNICNLKCDFCIGTKRKPEKMSINNFKIIISKIKTHTKYVYLHVLGEPLLHEDIGEILNICHENGIKANITTNGTLINKMQDEILKPALRQVNFSMHGVSDEYVKDILDFSERASENVYINLRYWNEYEAPEIKNKTIKKNIFVSYDVPFTWPKPDGEVIFTNGRCYGMKDHIAILVDGTVVPCCIDANGKMPLGNIFTQELDEILCCKRAVGIKTGFIQGKVVEEICKRCGFAQRLNKAKW